MPSLLSTMLKMEERLVKMENMEERWVKMENMEKRMMKMKDMEERMAKMKDMEEWMAKMEKMEERMAKMENNMEARIEEEVVKRVNEIRRKMEEESCLKANESEGKLKRLEAKLAVGLEEVKVKCVTRAKEAKEDIKTEIKKELTTARLQDWDYDPAEQRYCICNQVAYEEMVFCENEDCPHLGWFHFGCINISDAPPGAWYCPTCKTL